MFFYKAQLRGLEIDEVKPLNIVLNSFELGEYDNRGVILVNYEKRSGY